MFKLSTFYDHILEISKQEHITTVDSMRKAGELGIDYLEISGNNLVGREDEVGNELAYSGLKLSTVPAFLSFSPEVDLYEESSPIFEGAKYLGADKILVIPGFFAESDGERERGEKIKFKIEEMNRLIEMAGKYEISLMIEDFDSPLSPICSIAGVKLFLDSCPGLSWCFDTGNFRPVNESWEDAYNTLKDKLAYVHLKDRAYSGEGWAMPCSDGQTLYPAPVGGGELELEKAVSMVLKDGYDGAFSLEHYGAPDMLYYLTASAEWLKNQLNSNV